MRTRLLFKKNWGIYQDLLRAERMSPEELAELNFARRQEIVRFAYEKTPFYHRLYKDAGFEPGDLKTEEDWNRLPLVTKSMIRDHFDDFIARDVPEEFRKLKTSGGSTGEPVKFYIDRRFVIGTVRWRTWKSWGMGFGQNFAYIFRDGLIHPQTTFEKFWWLPSRRIFLDARNMTEGTIEAFIKEFRRIKPVYVHGYTGAVHEFALYCLDHKIDLPAPFAVAIFSAPLSNVQRAHIEKAFGAPCYNVYGCSECGNMSAQCKESVKKGCEGGLHINSDLRHLEFLDGTGHPTPFGVEGVVHITDFENHVFPFIRYSLNDRGRLLAEKCPCGLPFPLMGEIRGRETDLIFSKEGKRLDYADAMFWSYPDAVLNYRIHQNADYSVILYVVPNKNYPDHQREIQAVVDELTIKLGANTPVRLELCETIPHDGGKLRLITTDVKLPPVTDR